jgi:hypothetical protein
MSSGGNIGIYADSDARRAKSLRALDAFILLAIGAYLVAGQFEIKVCNFAQTVNRHWYYFLLMATDKYYQDLCQRLLELTVLPGPKTLRRIMEQNDLSAELNRQGNKITFRSPPER